MQGQPIPAPVSDALLFLSRVSIPASEKDHAAAVLARVEDWPLLTDIARRKFSLPFVYRNLQRLGLGAAYAPVLTAMHRQVLPTTLGSLHVLSAQRKFHQDCVAPLGLPHVYIKGPSLAVRYYDDPGLRFARDIDILVSRQDQTRLVHRALTLGYRAFDSNDRQSRPVSGRDLQAVMRYKTVVTLMSPENVTIEVHRNIDKRLGLFEVEDTLERRDSICDGRLDYGVMPTPDLFSYICYHNTRHIWSRLHWMADLDAIITDPAFDRTEVVARAEELGLRTTADACLDLHAIAISGKASAATKNKGRGAELAAICLKNFSGDLELEYELRKGEELIGLPFKWMVPKSVRARASNQTFLSRILPGYEDYEAWPLPRGLQWLYYIAKPLGILKRQLLFYQKQGAGR